MKIFVIHTGGTIGSAGTPLAPMQANRFADAARRILMPMIDAALPDIDLHFDAGLRFSDQGPGTLDSTNLQPMDWCRIAGAVLDGYGDHDGFVILHGTDTMDFTGAALPFLLNVFDGLGIGRAVLSKPVVLTGAQLPMFRETPDGLVLNPGSDAFANFCGALSVARLRLPEVALFFDGKLWRGSRALKTSSTRFSAFDSPHLPPLAEAAIGVWHGDAIPLPGPAAPRLSLDDPAARRLARDQLQAVAANIDAHPVIQLPAFPAQVGGTVLPRMIADAVAGGVKAIVLEAYGEGNFPSGNPQNADAGKIRNAIADATRAGVIVVDTSRLLQGQVGRFHYAAGAWIADAGAIGAGDMTPMAAFAKTAILMAAAGFHHWDGATLRTLIQRSLTGECHAPDRLDSRGAAALLPGQALSAVDGAARLVNDPHLGLRLLDRTGNALWSPAPGGPGRLSLFADGRLRLVGPNGATLWESPAIWPDAPGALLLLRHAENGAALLEIRSADARAHLPVDMTV